jgi:DNA-binding NtrC family response regulator
MLPGRDGDPAVRIDDGTDAETASPASQAGAPIRAVYVSGPSGGSRHVLPEGITSIGRATESDIVLDDPRASRLHVMLEVDAEIRLTDVGSANGTLVGGTRVASGEVRTLALGEAFFIGDSALVVRETALRRASNRIASWDALQRYLSEDSGRDPDGRTVIVGVRPLRPTRARALESILGALLTGDRDWLLVRRDGELLLGHEAPTEEPPLAFEDAVRRELASWAMPAEVESRLLNGGTKDLTPTAGDFFAAPDRVSLRRGKVVLKDPAMKALGRAVSRVAAARVNVLILGETGVGKDVVASMLHELSPRCEEPFLSVNCASLPEALLESELFGYERGAFTGAVASKPGLLEAADRGAVFLDELADLPFVLQAKLLRVIESQEVLRLGSLKPRPIDVRFLAATHRDLSAEVSNGRFREDLYHRLACIELQVPPLRDRPSEIEPLAEFFLQGAHERFGMPVGPLSWQARAALRAYPFPGNIRELKNIVERAALLSAGCPIEVCHLALPSARTPSVSVREAAVAAPVSLEATLSERERIAAVLNACGGNQSRAAGALGVSRRTLVRKIAQLGLPRPRGG